MATHALGVIASFMGISPELRNMIYQEVFTDNVVAIFKTEIPDDTLHGEAFENSMYGTCAPALLLCNKKIYSEDTTTYYQRSIFKGFHMDVHLLYWLRSLPPTRRAVMSSIGAFGINMVDSGPVKDLVAWAERVQKESDYLFMWLNAHGMGLLPGALKTGFYCVSHEDREALHEAEEGDDEVAEEEVIEESEDEDEDEDDSDFADDEVDMVWVSQPLNEVKARLLARGIICVE